MSSIHEVCWSVANKQAKKLTKWTEQTYGLHSDYFKTSRKISNQFTKNTQKKIWNSFLSTI